MRQRLKFLNAQIFANLADLQYISLLDNDCINFYFDLGLDFAYEVISKSCGYEESVYVEVACEKYPILRNQDYCLMTERTAINSTNFIIADMKDEEIEGIVFESNTNIEYLPYKIYMQFPNLDFYNAERCSIQQISKENFEKLSRLRSIVLSHNKIQKISGNTFKGLGNLLYVDLGEF